MSLEFDIGLKLKTSTINILLDLLYQIDIENNSYQMKMYFTWRDSIHSSFFEA